MDTPAPKYSRMEYERRFLVDPGADWRGALLPYHRELQDRYLACGRLRLRRLQDSDSGRVTFKLTKKFPSDSAMAQPIVSVWLTEDEYAALRQLPGWDLCKVRHYQEFGGSTFALDVYQGDLQGLILCEAEKDSLEALRAVLFPPYALWEVTQDPFFTGGVLCRAGRREMECAVALILDPAPEEGK